MWILENHKPSMVGNCNKWRKEGSAEEGGRAKHLLCARMSNISRAFVSVLNVANAEVAGLALVECRFQQ